MVAESDGKIDMKIVLRWKWRINEPVFNQQS
jgi:hypothetical protein